MNTDLTPFTEINSKWIIDINIKWESTKVPGKHIGENLGNLCVWQ